MNYGPVHKPYTIQKRKMTLSGKALLSVEPNIAEIHIGVVSENKELTSAQQESAQIINQVIDSLLKIGTSQEHIQTIDYTIFPRYDYAENNQIFKGYQVTHFLSVITENFSQIGTILDTAVRNGANRVMNIKFSVKNKDHYYRQALKMAMEDTLAKAQTISNFLNVYLDPIPASISEQINETPTFSYQTVSNSEVGGISTTIEPGRLDIEAKLETEFFYFA
ncbi:SIMPL domain-containing protein [Aquibacillus rhizosphaerae]|uniref:SIMPL domain-containing protein n=1 Tax=Aquibacillus rhizosphaerae TaxID=3051431 RepID=A0ABT7L8T8_9BACI|nr:SIMPL domain-containing protein [Aquibacillus sp. LR5S19]MDL4842293.1 SIMPL domain-containing protein [Aquibacillus sp. LR5S19]